MVVSAGTLTSIVWLSLGADIGFAIKRSATVVMIACPHALGLATSLVTTISTSISAKRGLLIRDRIVFESASKIDLVVFDKAGTQNESEFDIAEIRSIDVEEVKQLTLACPIELNSEHPVAKGIIK